MPFSRILLLIAFIAAPALAAAETPFDQFFSKSNSFLPVDQAFVISAEAAPKAINVRWEIADEYYLYRHQLKFSAKDANEQTVNIGEPEIPIGRIQHDEYFGEVETYHQRLLVRLPIENFSGGEISLSVTYQGCAEKGLCYPPTTQVIPVQLPIAQEANQVPPAIEPGSNSEPQEVEVVASTPATPNTDDALQQQLTKGFSTQLLATFFGLGLLLAFTPCVLPMIPILSGIVVGAKTGAGRGFTLSLSYVLAMSAAYALLGAAAGVAGSNLQIAMQHPVVILSFSTLFVLLALAMFGFYQLQLPEKWQGRLTAISNQQKGGSLPGAAMMGLLSALIVGPCLTPPLAAALLYISRTGDALLGSQALFALGLGMGAPLLIAGTAGASLLPRAGAWMQSIQRIFGFILCGVAIWLAARVISPTVTLSLWALLAVGAGLYFLQTAGQRSLKIPLQAAGITSIAWGVVLIIGAATGAKDPLKPLAAIIGNHQSTQHALDFSATPSFEVLQQQLASGRMSMLDFYADWCVSCIVMENEIFPAAPIAEKLSHLQLLRADVTRNSDQDQELMKKLEVIGPPSLLFFNEQGEELRALRIIGEITQDEFEQHLKQVLSSSQPKKAISNDSV